MAVNIGQYSQQRTPVAFYGGLVGSYFNGTTSTILANGSGQGMGRFKGFNTLSVTQGEPTPVPVLGDNGRLPGGYMNPPTDVGAAAMALTVCDQNFKVLANGYKVNTVGDYDQILTGSSCVTFNPLIAVLNTYALSFEPATAGQPGWAVNEFWNATAFVQEFTEFSYMPDAASTWAATMSMFEAALTPWGEVINPATWGKKQGTGTTYFSPNPVTYHAYVGTGLSSQTVTLDETPAAANSTAVEVWFNGVLKAYTTDYTVNTSTKVVTFTGTGPGAGVVVTIRYQFIYTC